MLGTVAPPTVHPRQRDPAIDLLRTLAIARVVLWHIFAATWMTFFAAMPLLFFIAGVLLAASSERESHWAVLFGRVRRLLLPVWLYGTVVLLGGVTYAYLHRDVTAGAAVMLGDAATWLIPLVDPRSSAAPNDWLTTHLWYIRAFLWVLVLTPLLLRLARHLRLALPVLGAALVAVLTAGHLRVPVLGSGPAHVVIGDAVVYGTFVVLGMAHQHGRLRPRLRPALGALILLALGIGVYVTRVGVSGGGVNDSYPLTLLTGLAWLLVAAALEPSIRKLACVGAVSRVASAVNRRAVTIYLWHPAAIVIGYGLVGRLGITDRFAPLGAATVVTVTVGLTALATHTVGWMEDLAANRKRGRAQRGRRDWTGRGSPALTSLAVTLVLVALPLTPEPTALASRGGGSSSSALPPPSYRPALTEANFAGTTVNSRTRELRLPGGSSNDALQATLDRWLEERPDVGSVAVAVAIGGDTWAGDAHRAGTVSHSQVGNSYGVASVTKTFTLALVLRAVDQGRIKLDEPVPLLSDVGSPPQGTIITPRQLLQHTSGLVDYPAAPGYDSSVVLTPSDAVRLALDTPLRSPPGEQVSYANSNYHYLGLLLERVYNRPYAKLVADLVRSVGLPATRVEPTDRPGWTGFASGGIHSTVADLARWGGALFTPGRLLSPTLSVQLRTVGPDNIGLVGTWPLCPCFTDDSGQKRYTAIGQHTGYGGLYHTPEGVTVAVRMELPVDSVDVKTSSLIEALLRTLRPATEIATSAG